MFWQRRDANTILIDASRLFKNITENVVQMQHCTKHYYQTFFIFKKHFFFF